MKVEELMTAPVITCREEDSLDTAAALMRSHGCGVVPVLDPTDSIVGMITDRDICMAIQEHQCLLQALSVAEVIDGFVFAVGPSDSIKYAEELMRANRVRRLPVLDDARSVVGILSINDIAREGHRASFLSEKYRRIGSDEIVSTLATISEPTPRSHKGKTSVPEQFVWP